MEDSFDFNYSTVDVNRLIRIAEERTRSRTKPGVVLNFMIGAAECHLVTDENRLLQVLMHLLANACNSTTRGNISFGYKLRGNELYFFVKDTGWGIPADMLPEVFNNSTPGGPGAGMAICRMIVQNLGGQMGVESAGEGQGATYWFTLPYDESLDYLPEENTDEIYGRTPHQNTNAQHAPAYQQPVQPQAAPQPAPAPQPAYPQQPVQPQAAPQPAPAPQPAYPQQPVQPQATPQPAPAPQPAQPQQQVAEAPASQPAGSGKPYVLIAEDNASNFLLFEAVLSPYYRIEHAWDGVEAFELFTKERPDIVLMDINMPRKDGYEATADIRRVDQQVPIIAVTAYAFASDRERILRSGFNSYISKPINPPRLLQEMNNLLQA